MENVVEFKCNKCGYTLKEYPAMFKCEGCHTEYKKKWPVINKQGR